MKGFQRKDLVSIDSLSKDEILMILDTADSMKQILRRDRKKVPPLQGKTAVMLFIEASTRTRTSFELAAKRLSADTISLTPDASSLTKGETLFDTVKNLEAMQVDYVVLRHPQSGAAERLAKQVDASVVNAGDGWHEHPTQALLDLMTIRERFQKFEGLNVLIVGDIAHSRVARSNIYGLNKLGAKVMVAGPGTLIPPGLAGDSEYPVEVYNRLEDALPKADVVMMLRIQLERIGQSLFPSEGEYARFFGLTAARLKLAKSHAIVMHPGPVNRGLEIASDVVDGSSSVILPQVENGVATRMAVLYLLNRSPEAVRGEA